MSRLPPLPRESYDQAQQALFETITGGSRSTGDPAEFLNPDGGLRGPFDALLRSPQLGDAVQAVGEQIRFHTHLPGALRELAILVCAAHWRANYEWHVHRKVGLREGLDETTVDGIKTGREPAVTEQKIVYRFIVQLNRTGRINDALYEETVALLSEQGVVELTLLSGYYATIAQILNVFVIPVPDGEDTPFAD